MNNSIPLMSTSYSQITSPSGSGQLKNTPIRPLTAAYMAAKSENEVMSLWKYCVIWLNGILQEHLYRKKKVSKCWYLSCSVLVDHCYSLSAEIRKSLNKIDRLPTVVTCTANLINICLFQVVQSSQAPKKNTGFVSKAMEYMFGW